MSRSGPPSLGTPLVVSRDARDFSKKSATRIPKTRGECPSKKARVAARVRRPAALTTREMSLSIAATAGPFAIHRTRPRGIRARSALTAGAGGVHRAGAVVASRIHVESRYAKNVRAARVVKTAALPPIALPTSVSDILSVSRTSQELALGAAMSAFALWVLPSIMKASWENIASGGRAEALMEGVSSLVLPTRAFSPKDAQLGAKLRRKARELATWETSIAQVTDTPEHAPDRPHARRPLR